MSEIDDLIADAWRRIRQTLLLDQHELAKRLARRRKPVLQNPPRAWCLAIRASDTRIESSPPARSLDPNPEDPITLTADSLRKLCLPVTFPPGLTLDEVAGLLGTTPIGVRNGRLNGTFRTRHVAGLGGHHGKPVPLLSADRPLDPGAKNFANPDPVWSWTAEYLVSRIPKDLELNVMRVPVYKSHVGRHAFDPNRHPEVDPVSSVPGKSKRLPASLPDPACWYKWSRGDYYLGDDPSNWRKDPKDLGDRPPKYLPRNRTKRRPKPSRSKGSLHFNGYQWLCPVCNKTCRTIYCPLPPMNLLRDVPRLAQCIDIPRKVKGFACARCHRVKFFSRVPSETWNQVIAHMTQGLLYGREVPRPEWFTKDRKRPYKPHTSARPALRREQVLQRLLKGHRKCQIATDLCMSKAALTQHINKIYKSERLRGQRALLAKYNRPLPAHLVLSLVRVLEHHRAGLTLSQIATKLGVTRQTVQHYLCELRRRGQLPPHRTKRTAVAELFTAGYSRQQIATALNMTPQSVSTRLCELRQFGRLPPARAKDFRAVGPNDFNASLNRATRQRSRTR